MCNIVVSVCMITYNHENFIREAIEGVLMQKTDFPIELIIGEDCSTDNTRKIVVEYANKYPNIIRLLLPDYNLGMMKNFVETLDAANGKYIALCEGDDYWTDPYKLQKQVDFLEANEEFVMCGHQSTQLFSGKNTEIGYLNTFKGGAFMPINIWEEWMIATASLVFRTDIINCSKYRYYASHRDMLQGDIILLLSAFEFGKVYAMPDTMSVYRKHDGSVTADGSSPKTERMQKMLNYIRLIGKVYNGKYRKISKRYYSFKAFRYSYVCKERGLYYKSFSFLLKSFISSPSKFYSLFVQELNTKFKKKA